MKAFSAILFVAAVGTAAAVSVTTTSGSHATKKSGYASGELIFEEVFNSLDYDVWQHESTLAGGGNWEFQWYTNNRSNSYAQNGNLHIRPTLTNDDIGDAGLTSVTLNLHGGTPADGCTNAAFYGCERGGSASNIINPIKSARLRTLNSFNWKYGTMEARAKMPTGDWLWPAIWLMPKNNAYGTWPSSGEIDLMESRGNRELYSGATHVGNQQVGQTLHFGPRPDLNGYPMTNWVRNAKPGFNEDFHTFKFVWTPTSITFYIDGVVTSTVDANADGGFWNRGQFNTREPGRENPWSRGTIMAPFDEEFYILINLAVGGVAYFDDGFTSTPPKPWSNQSPTAAADFWNGRGNWLSGWNLATDDSHLQVDYVRVWAL